MFDLDRDSIIIFPSKTAHATAQIIHSNQNFNFGYVTIMLKDSEDFEHLMPNFKNWTNSNYILVIFKKFLDIISTVIISLHFLQ